MTSDTVLRVEGLRKSFVTSRDLLGRPTYFDAVRDVDLTLKRGETVAVVGESGAGKSTVGRLVLRLIEPDGGEIEFDGADIRALRRGEMRKLRSRMRMVFQDPYSSLDPTMVVADIVAEPLKVHTGLSADERRAKVLDLLQRVGMDTHHLDRYPYEFSGGQLQRIAIARAIATDPDLIVCDEPVAALDMSIRAQVVNLLRDLQAERGIAYLFITHDLSLVRLIADRVVVMYRGRIVESAPAEELFADARHPYTRALLEAVPTPDTSRRHNPRKLPMRSASTAPPEQGCDFAPRCPFAFDTCTTVDPTLINVGPPLSGMDAAQVEHRVSCHLNEGHGVDASREESRILDPA